MRTQVDVKSIKVKTTSVRRYNRQFFAYGEAIYNGNVIDMGDAFPSSVFPLYEAVTTVLMRIEGIKEVSEKDFRSIFKGVKNGGNLYARMAEVLEERFNVEFI